MKNNFKNNFKEALLQGIDYLLDNFEEELERNDLKTICENLNLLGVKLTDDVYNIQQYLKETNPKEKFHINIFIFSIFIYVLETCCNVSINKKEYVKYQKDKIISYPSYKEEEIIRQLDICLQLLYDKNKKK